MDSRRERLLTLLRGALEPRAEERALQLAQRTGRPLEQVLNQLGLVPDEVLLAAYAEVSGCEVWRPDLEPPLSSAGTKVRPEFLHDRRLLLVGETDRDVVVASCDPFDDESFAGLAFATGKTIVVRVTTLSELRRHAGGAEAPEARSVDDTALRRDLTNIAAPGSGSQAGRLLEEILETAVARRASDIHIEPRRSELVVRLRVDGLLVDWRTCSASLSAAVVSRVKVLSNLDLGEQRAPQDGRATFVVQGAAVETRVSIVPTVFGESAVLRVLDRVGVSFDLASLGAGEKDRLLLEKVAGRPHGMFLVAGPTGSGKTTTLYSLLNLLSGAGRKILSAEDPVEHHFAHVSQVQVAPAIGLTFASALRAFLRQDPDVILVGEVRDSETAAVAIQAALTGHLVLASIHANDAVRAIPRLLDMGVEPYQLSAGFVGAAAQRLVRRLCAKCAHEREATAAERAFVASLGLAEPARTWVGAGCADCSWSGFHGRLAVMETFVSGDALSSLIARRAPLDELYAEARRDGLRPMLDDGAAKALRGLTTLQEVMAMVQA